MQHEPGSGNGQHLRLPGSPRCCQHIQPNCVSRKPIGAGKKIMILGRRKETDKEIDRREQTDERRRQEEEENTGAAPKAL
jgi:hypothetical protein